MRFGQKGSAVLSSDECRLEYIEVHPLAVERKGRSTGELRSRLEDYGFSIEELNNQLWKVTT
jgi:hypothetical protein